MGCPWRRTAGVGTTLPDAIIETDGLTRIFGSRKAVGELTFTVGRGETVALLGTNGSGKTTTMRMLCGYLPPTEGTARVAGFDVLSHSLDVRRAVGYLPEDVPLYKDLTITDSLRFFGRLRKMDGARLDPRIDEVVEQVGMSAYRDVLIGKLSKGYRQRAGLAIAILHDPPVLILDEPTASIDPVQAAEIRDLIRSLGGQHTVLLSTHQMWEAAELCGRAVVLREGALVADGPIAEIGEMDTSERRIALEVEDGAKHATSSLLREMATVVTVEEAAAAWPGVAAFTITGQGARLVNDLVVALVRVGIVVVSIAEERPGLEKAFLELARGPGTGTRA
jgi:ABC-2 type transport system ATP-binding protein